MEQEKSVEKLKKPGNKKQIWLWILMSCLLIIFIASILIFVGGWWIYKDKVQDNISFVEDQESYFDSDQWVDDLDSYFLDEESMEDFADEDVEPNIINGTEKFVSNEYGYTLNFTRNWIDYKVALKVDEDINIFGPSSISDTIKDEDIAEQLRDGFVAEYVFYYPTNQSESLSVVDGYEDLFALGIYRLDDYEAISSGKIKEIGRNNIYLFTYSNYYLSGDDADLSLPQDIPQAAIDDIKGIAEGIETFDVRVLE